MSTTPKRASLADVNKRLWLLAYPMAEVASNVQPGLSTMPVFVHELGDGQACLLGADLKPIKGGSYPAEDLKAMYADQAIVGVDFAIPPALAKVMKDAKRRLDSPKIETARIAAAEIFAAAVQAGIDMNLDGWLECERRLQRERYTSHVWFERDRANVRLVDELTGLDIVDLWDEAVTEAIEDGYLTAPGGARPDDADWLEPLMDYARQVGAIESSLEIRSNVGDQTSSLTHSTMQTEPVSHSASVDQP